MPPLRGWRRWRRWDRWEGSSPSPSPSPSPSVVAFPVMDFPVMDFPQNLRPFAAVPSSSQGKPLVPEPRAQAPGHSPGPQAEGSAAPEWLPQEAGGLCLGLWMGKHPGPWA